MSANGRNSRPDPGTGIMLGFIIMLAGVFIFGCDEAVPTEPTPTAAVEVTVEPTIEPTPEAIPEQGTTAMVDHIIRQAKNDASGPDAEAKAEIAYAWIVETVPQWYDGPEIMEEAIYNGALVQYYYEDKNEVRSEIGSDVVQSVKYVYRGAESVLDDSTQKNINQIREGIAEDQAAR